MYSIVNIDKNQIDQIIEISNNELGEGFISKVQLNHYINSKKKYICKLAIKDNMLLGFSIGIIVDSKYLKLLMGKDFERLPNSFLNNHFIYGQIKTIVVNSNYQLLGIGTALCESTIIDLKKLDANKLIATAWKQNNKVNSAKMLQKFGLKHLCEIPFFWKDESIKEKYNCKVCGLPPCICTAVIYGG